jgi:hypothetical protein
MLKFRQMSGRYAIVRLDPKVPTPAWATTGEFISITRSDEELSIVCPANNLPPDVPSQQCWICLKLEGPFAFSQTGILLSFIAPLSDNRIPIFAISTFDTDYVLVQEEFSRLAIGCLQQAGHKETSDSPP